MAGRETVRIGRRGTLVIPAELRRRYGLEEGSTALVEAQPDGILVRPTATLPIEVYDPARKAELLLNNATDQEEYAWARDQVRRLGLDPDSVPHSRPSDD